MSHTIAYFVFKVLPTIAALAYTIYLAYILRNSARRKAIMSKYEKDARVYNAYDKVYSPRSLGACIFITLFLVFSIAFDIYKATHRPSLFAIYFGLALTILTLSAGLYLWPSFSKRK